MPGFLFTYGSNMSPREMNSSLPGAVDAGPAKLSDHRLSFTRLSKRWGAGAAGIDRVPGLCLWGRLYQLPAAVDWDDLDKREGVAVGAYQREERRITRLDGSDVAATVYTVAEPMETELAPRAEYMQLMIEGATVGERLPDSYVNFLRYLARRASSASDGAVDFAPPYIVLPTRKTGKGSGPTLEVPLSDRIRKYLLPYVAVTLEGRTVMARARANRSLARNECRLDQSARAQLTHRSAETYGYRVHIDPVVALPTAAVIRPRVTLLNVSAPAITDAEQGIAVLHAKSLELLGLVPGDHVKVRALGRPGKDGKWQTTRASLRAYTGTAADLAHAGRARYPVESEIGLDLETRRSLDVAIGDAVWVSASTWPLLRQRLFFYAITVFLGIAALRPVFSALGISDPTATAASAVSTLILTFLVAVAELRQKVGV